MDPYLRKFSWNALRTKSTGIKDFESCVGFWEMANFATKLKLLTRKMVKSKKKGNKDPEKRQKKHC